MGMERDVGVGREGLLKSTGKKAVQDIPSGRHCRGSWWAAAPRRPGSRSSPALRAAPDAPKHEGGELEHLTSISTAGNKTSLAALGVWQAPLSGSRAPEHKDKPWFLTPGAGSSWRSVAGSEGTLL